MKSLVGLMTGILVVAYQHLFQHLGIILFFKPTLATRFSFSPAQVGEEFRSLTFFFIQIMGILATPPKANPPKK